MSKLVQLLDLLGRNPKLLSDDAYAQAVSAFDLDDQIVEAVMAREPERLTTLLQLPSISYCALFPAEDEPVREDEDDQKEDSPDKEENASIAA